MSVVDEYLSHLPEDIQEHARAVEENERNLDDTADDSDILRAILSTPEISQADFDPFRIYETIAFMHEPGHALANLQQSPQSIVEDILNTANLQELTDVVREDPAGLRDRITEIYHDDTLTPAEQQGVIDTAMTMMRDMFLSGRTFGRDRIDLLDEQEQELRDDFKADVPIIPVEERRPEDFVAELNNRKENILGFLQEVSTNQMLRSGIIPIDEDEKDEKKEEEARRRLKPTQIPFDIADALIRAYGREFIEKDRRLQTLIAEREAGLASGTPLSKSKQSQLQKKYRNIIRKNPQTFIDAVAAENITDVPSAQAFRGRLDTILAGIPDPNLDVVLADQEQLAQLGRRYLSGRLRRSVLHSAVRNVAGLSPDEYAMLDTALNAATEDLDIDHLRTQIDNLPQETKDAIPRFDEIANAIGRLARQVNTRKAEMDVIKRRLGAIENDDSKQSDEDRRNLSNDLRAARDEIARSNTDIVGLLYRLGPEARDIIEQNVVRNVRDDIESFNEMREEFDRNIGSQPASVQSMARGIRNEVGVSLSFKQAKDKLQSIFNRGNNKLVEVVDNRDLLAELQQSLAAADGTAEKAAFDARHTRKWRDDIAQRFGIGRIAGRSRDEWRRDLLAKLQRAGVANIEQVKFEIPGFEEFELDEKIDEDLKKLIGDKPDYVGPSYVRATFSSSELPLAGRYGEIRVYVERNGILVRIREEDMEPGVEYYIETSSPELKRELIRKMERKRLEQFRMPSSRIAREDLEDSRSRKMTEDEVSNVGGALSLVPIHPEEKMLDMSQKAKLPHLGNKDDPFHQWMRTYTRSLNRYMPEPTQTGEVRKRDVATVLKELGKPRKADLQRHFRNPVYRRLDHPLLDDPALKGIKEEAHHRAKMMHNVLRAAHSLSHDPAPIEHALIPIEEKPRIGEVGGNIFDDIGNFAKRTANNVGRSITDSFQQAGRDLSAMGKDVENKVIHEGQRIIDAEAKHWGNTKRRLDSIAQDAGKVVSDPSLENVGRFGRGVIDVAREGINAVQNDPVLGVPVTLASAILLPELGTVKTGLDIISMASHGDFDGSVTAALSALAEKEAENTIPGYKEIKLAEDTGKKINQLP